MVLFGVTLADAAQLLNIWKINQIKPRTLTQRKVQNLRLAARLERARAEKYLLEKGSSGAICFADVHRQTQIMER